MLVAVPVASTVWRGTLGQQPVDETSDTLAQIAPEVVEQAHDDDLVVTNSIIKIDPVELGLPVMLSRAGIDWIERDDPAPRVTHSSTSRGPAPSTGCWGS